MRIIYLKEIEETCDIVKRVIVKIKSFFNTIKIESINDNIIYYLPMYKDSKISKYRTKKLCNKINKLLEKDGANTVILSEYLSNIELLKNYLYSENINILDGRYLFKCLSNKILEYIFKNKGKRMEQRRSFVIN